MACSNFWEGLILKAHSLPSLIYPVFTQEKQFSGFRARSSNPGMLQTALRLATCLVPDGVSQGYWPSPFWALALDVCLAQFTKPSGESHLTPFPGWITQSAHDIELPKIPPSGGPCFTQDLSLSPQYLPDHCNLFSYFKPFYNPTVPHSSH